MTESGFRVFVTGSSGKLKPKLNLTGINTHLTGNLKNKTKQNSMAQGPGFGIIYIDCSLYF